jgi:hypothetical protein
MTREKVCVWWGRFVGGNAILGEKAAFGAWNFSRIENFPRATHSNIRPFRVSLFLYCKMDWFWFLRLKIETRLYEP